MNERKCVHCGILEDEFHFTLECNNHKDLRYTFINKNVWLRPNMPKFINLINSDNHKTIKDLALYVYHAFKNRHTNN